MKVEKIYDTEIVPGKRTFEVCPGAVVLVPQNGNGFKEVVCWLPMDISKRIMEKQKNYVYCINNDGWLCECEFKEEN